MGLLSTIVSFSAGYALAAKTGAAPIRRVRSGSARWGGRSVSSGALPRDVQVRDVMTAAPETVTLDATLTAAARLMAENDIGDVIVIEPGHRTRCGHRHGPEHHDPRRCGGSEPGYHDRRGDLQSGPRRRRARRLRATRHRSDGGPEGAATARRRGRPGGRDRVARRSGGRNERRIGARRDQRRRPGSLSRTSCSSSCSS